ncbi:MAG: class I SAM-dependent methyltransferase [Eubacteriales bacterium]|nr:class I SAM-dependent methyltransferase [Eubacteriales bacterium]
MTRNEEKIEEYWEVRSDSYSEQNIEEMNSWKLEAWRKKILSAAPDGECLKVLDIGTGPGFFAMNLALAGHDVTAVDLNMAMLQHAKKNAESYGAKIQFEQMNGDRLQFPDNSFDLVVNRNIIWNLEQPEQAIREWKRVLKPGGRMVYFDANWYLYLFDEDVAKKRAEGQRQAGALYPERTSYSGNVSNAEVHMLEEVSRTLPLSPIHRPQWDRRFLTEIGMKIVQIQEDISSDVLDEWETLMYIADPMFMVCAEKYHIDAKD